MLRRPVTVHAALENEVRIPADCLAEMGVPEGGPASVQAARGRLVLVTPRSVRQVQAELWELARGLEDLRDRLTEMCRELPEPPDPMLRAEVPADVEADIQGTLECVVSDDLDPAIEKLRAAAAVTAQELREHWERNRPGRS
jgi:antitoxin component of MazEF toxin-antitoxin module